MNVSGWGRVLIVGGCLPLAFAVAGEFARVSLRAAPLSIAPDLAQPFPVATTWHDFGANVFVTLLVAIAVASVAYAFVLRNLFSGEYDSRARITLVGIALLGTLSVAAALTFPIIFSSDVYAYAAYGKMAAAGINPYSHLPLSLKDPLTVAALWQWGNPPPLCVYGPAFVWLAKTIVRAFEPAGSLWQLFALRALAGFSLVVCGQLMFWALRGRPISHRLVAAAGITLNPVALWSASEGHNDALMLLVVLCGFIMVRSFGLTIGSFVIAASSLVKAPGLAAGIVLSMYAWPARSRFLKVAVGLCSGVCLTAIVARPFEAGIRNVLVPRGHYTPQFSAQYLFSEFARQLFGDHAHTLELGVAIALVASGALMLYGVRLALAGKLDGAAFIALGLWLAIPNPYPWYALWILPVAFLTLGTSASMAILVASLAVFTRYLPDVAVANNTDLNLVVTLCEIALPMVLLLPKIRSHVPNTAIPETERSYYPFSH